jgi:hypothetical protein
MKLLDKLSARRRRKAHERYVEEREWQRKLAERDTTVAMRDAMETGNVMGQAGTSGNQL